MTVLVKISHSGFLFKFHADSPDRKTRPSPSTSARFSIKEATTAVAAPAASFIHQRFLDERKLPLSRKHKKTLKATAVSSCLCFVIRRAQIAPHHKMTEAGMTWASWHLQTLFSVLGLPGIISNWKRCYRQKNMKLSYRQDRRKLWKCKLFLRQGIL